MALPPILQGGALPSELDFWSTTYPSTAISIVPLLSIDRVRLLTGIYGPFRPPQPSTVPLWLALYLRNKKKALLIPPAWMSLPALTETLKAETSQPGFATLPFEWIGVSNAILRHAAEDVREANKVRGVLKDIREARQSKVLAGVGMVNSVHLEMTGISLHEIAELRPFFTTAFLHLKALQPGSSRPTPSYTDTFDTAFPLAALESDPDASDPLFPSHLSDSIPASASFASGAEADAEDEVAGAPIPLGAGTGAAEESMVSDEFSFGPYETGRAGWNAWQARGRSSNVSDSGYATATRPRKEDGRDQREASGEAARRTARNGERERRPPRFDVDGSEEEQ